jgi:two-component system LytT family response regulator
MRAVIADDEELARGLMREYLSHDADIEIVAECSNGFDAVKAAGEHKPDVLFLDIQMPKLDGFEVLELVDEQIAVVFVTAFDQYAMKAFEAAAVDYLLKPFTPERLRESVERVKRRIGKTRPTVARPPGQYLERIVVKDGPTVHVIPSGKLDCAEAQDDYVSLRSDGRNWLKQQTIASLESALDPARFLRAHRSWLVNIEKIVRVEPNTKDTWLAILRDGTQVPLSRTGYAKFRELTRA